LSIISSNAHLDAPRALERGANLAMSAAAGKRGRTRSVNAAERKEPLEDAEHVRNAIARFDQVKDVTDEERDEAWKRIKAAARKFDVDVSEKSWHELGRRPH
jgi:hypothetical protein